MAAISAAQLLHPRPGRANAVGPQLLVRQGKSPLISQLTSISRGHATIYWLVDEGGSNYSSAPTTTSHLMVLCPGQSMLAGTRKKHLLT